MAWTLLTRDQSIPFYWLLLETETETRMKIEIAPRTLHMGVGQSSEEKENDWRHKGVLVVWRVTRRLFWGFDIVWFAHVATKVMVIIFWSCLSTVRFRVTHWPWSTWKGVNNTFSAPVTNLLHFLFTPLSLSHSVPLSWTSLSIPPQQTDAILTFLQEIGEWKRTLCMHVCVHLNEYTGVCIMKGSIG